MRNIIVILITLGAVTATAQTTNFDAIFDKYELEFELPKGLVKAICSVESDLREKVVVFNDGGKGDNGYGLCQVQYHTARMLGMSEDLRCTGRVSRNCRLLTASVNIYYAALYIRNQYKRYDYNLIKTISSYNAGSYIKGNHKYVRKVLKRFEEIEQ